MSATRSWLWQGAEMAKKEKTPEKTQTPFKRVIDAACHAFNIGIAQLQSLDPGGKKIRKLLKRRKRR
jgi:hypothetical protein